MRYVEINEHLFQPDSSVGGLLLADPFPTNSFMDIAIAKDVKAGAFDISALQKFYMDKRGEIDLAGPGDSRASWIGRLGGTEAVLQTLQLLPLNHRSRDTLMTELSCTSPDNSWIYGFAATETNPRSLRVVLLTAMERNIDEAVATVSERLDGIDAVTPLQEDTEISWMRADVDVYKLKSALRSGQCTITHDSVPNRLPPIDDDPEIIADKEKPFDYSLSPKQRSRAYDELLKKRRDTLHDIVIGAVLGHDASVLYEYVRSEVMDVSNLLTPENEFNGYTGAEVTMAQLGIDFIERGTLDGPKPPYEISDAGQLWESFSRAAQEYQVIKGDYMGIPLEIRKNAYGTAFWLTQRLGQLKRDDILKSILNHPKASIEVKKEAVRWLVILRELDYLRRYSITHPSPVNFWKTLFEYQVVKKKSQNIPHEEQQFREITAFEAYRRLQQRLAYDLPAYIVSILG